MFFLKKKTIFIFLVILLVGFFKGFVYAEDSSIKECNDNHINVQDCPAYLQNKLNLLQGQAKTLSSQIAIMDNQIYLTQARIEANKREILDLTLDIDTATKKISTLSDSLTKITEVLLNRIVATYETGSIQPLEVLLSSTNASNYLSKLNYLRIVQAHDKRLIYDVQQAKNDYTNQKDIFETKKTKVETLKKQLEAYTVQLNQEKQTKQDLLAQTQGSETAYQQLIIQAQAQLAGFSSFAASQGGASILTNQTVCDDWGCYYNQRDSRWGTLSLDGTGYTIASDGCLVTSMAMVLTHYGSKKDDITPITINSDRLNFASYNAAYLNKILDSPRAVRSTQAYAYSPGAIDSELSQGRPVIIGIRYSNGDTHFVVLVSGSNGDYLMNDPFVPNGHKIKFTDHYPLNSIFEIDYISL
jgi:peptidoglycan hydrolase CwlO-like protein